MNTTELLEQCQKWHENDEFDKIIEALEALDAATRGAEVDSILARAYNNAADPSTDDGKEKLRRAIELLESHEDEHSDIDVWNYRLAYAYYYLDEELKALYYFKRAAKLDPDDKDAPEFIDSCRNILSLPIKRLQFRERVEQAWHAFVEREAHIRAALAEDKDHSNGAAIVSEISDILEKAISGIALEVGFNGSKYELILSSDGDLLVLFMLVYLRKHMPESLNEHWSVLVGRHSAPGLAVRMGDVEVSADDIQVWVRGESENNKFALELYCSKLDKLMQEDEDKVWFILVNMTDQVLGEVAHMRYISDFDVLAEAKDEESILLRDLPQKIRELGADTSISAEDFIENSYMTYHASPEKQDEYELRSDIIAGVSRSVRLLSAYNAAAQGDEEAILEMEYLYDSGAVAGFIAYPLDKFEGEDRTDQILNFRDAFVEHLNKVCGPDVFMFLGGATGVENGYIDLIAWDLKPVLEAAESFTADHDEIDAAVFKTFFYESKTIGIVNKVNNDNDTKGHFLNFVLLDEPVFDKQQLIADLKAQWNIDAIEDDEDASEDPDKDMAKKEDIHFFEHEGMRGIVMLMHCPIPNDEAVIHAQNNYMWPEGVEVAQKHKAHLVVTVLGDDEDDELMNRAIFHTQLTAACCLQKHATAVNFAGSVVSNDDYATMANFIKDDELPLFNWIWFGLHKTEDGINAYTYGMGLFGKINMEVSSPDAKPSELRDFIVNLAHYVIESDATLEDGQTIGFSETDKHTITLSQGIALPDEMTLKISFKPDAS